MAAAPGVRRGHALSTLLTVLPREEVFVFSDSVRPPAYRRIVVGQVYPEHRAATVARLQ